ncbi:hypothetical protein GCM10010256_71210 [Streptomyces coeruleorubidus]|uniref:Uncharacterized protein n=2 Tax=Streptomyces coeruleorubidus TaxID=116188 RepID=A0A5J6HZ07_STRC4|nr:hypothetical protein CP976_05520 [Streptomyces coeruleorubidus]GGU00870.1 hypothetical protein GCM10010256_71210 [Streptomyces coeruleorubidus]
MTGSLDPTDGARLAYHRRAPSRCPGMDSTETARRLLGNDAAPRSYAELTSGYGGHPPIYAALVAEWQARGHEVPEHRDGQWVSFAAPSASETWAALTTWTVGRHPGTAAPDGTRLTSSRPPRAPR